LAGQKKGRQNRKGAISTFRLRDGEWEVHQRFIWGGKKTGKVERLLVNQGKKKTNIISDKRNKA